MNYLIVLFALIPGYLWHIGYVRSFTGLTLPYSTWKLLLPLVFISFCFLTVTFFSMETGFYPKCLTHFSERYIFSMDIFQCTNNESMGPESTFCKNIEAIRLFINSILLIALLSVILGVYKFFADNLFVKIKNITKKSIGKDTDPFDWKKWIFAELINLIYWILLFPLNISKKVLTHIYMLEDREENRFLKYAVDKSILVTLKSNRVYVGILIEADLRQNSDDDDALLLCLMLSGYRDTTQGILKYKTFYEKYSPTKLLFMREIESVSIYDEDVAPIFVAQKSVEYPPSLQSHQ